MRYKEVLEPMHRYRMGFEANRIKVFLTMFVLPFWTEMCISWSHREEETSCVEECLRAGNDFKFHKAAVNIFSLHFSPATLCFLGWISGGRSKDETSHDY